jgi:RNA polymerase sigma factor (sigma-70 family)
MSNDIGESSDENDMGFSISPAKVREAVYETILSIDGLAAAATDNASPFDFIKDPSAMPDEKAEIVEMSKLIKQAIAKLPQKERTVVEYRFYRNMQAKDIANMVGLSPSRITRIVQFSLNQIREYLKARGREDY